MASVRMMGWISILIALAILGMGGAPIAEKLEIVWLQTGLTWLAYGAVAFLTVAALVLGGIGIQHGILVLLGRDVPVSPRGRSTHRRAPARPRVSGPSPP